MPKLVTQVNTTVIRDGKRVTPQIGAAFEYTEAEAEYIRKASGPLALRKPVNESATDTGTQEPGTDARGNPLAETDDAGTAGERAAGDKPSKGAKAGKAKAAPKAKETKAADDDDDDDDDDEEDI